MLLLRDYLNQWDESGDKWAVSAKLVTISLIALLVGEGYKGIGDYCYVSFICLRTDSRRRSTDTYIEENLGASTQSSR